MGFLLTILNTILKNIPKKKARDINITIILTNKKEIKNKKIDI